jgi:hypothetical protein
MPLFCSACTNGCHEDCPIIGCDCDCFNEFDEEFYDVNENETIEKDGYA